MRYRFLFILMAGLAVAAQEPKAKQTQDAQDLETMKKLKAVVAPEPERKIFILKYADAQVIGNLLSQVFGSGISSNREMKVIAVSGLPTFVAAVGEAITKLDVPPQPVRNIEITGYLLVGSAKTEPGGSVPAELESVVKQIRAAFPYKDFQLVDSMVVRTQPQSRYAQVSGIVASSETDSSGKNITYKFQIQSPSISQEGKSTMIRLGGLNLSMRVPVIVGKSPNSTNWSFENIGIETDVDIREGQKVVVGKSSFGSADKALFLVLTAKVVD